MSKLSMEQVIETLTKVNQNIEILSTEFESTLSKMDFKCKVCGSEWKSRYVDVKQGAVCPVCAVGKNRQGKKFTFEKAKERANLNYPHLEILGTIYTSGGKVNVKCKDCGYEREVGWKKLLQFPRNDNKNCPNCSNRIVNENNRLSTIRPDLIQYFKNKSEAYEVSIGMEKYVDLICPICKTEYTMQVNHLSRRPFSCKICSDGISKGEKILTSLLSQANIKFETQKKFEWSKNKIYDFYIPSLNIICEVDGLQHRRESFSMRTTPEKEQINDSYKEALAYENGISSVIRVKYEFDINYIKREYFEKLKDIIDFSKIDWAEAFKYCGHSNMKTICDIYNETKNKLEIQRRTGISQVTIRKYVALGRELGLVED